MTSDGLNKALTAIRNTLIKKLCRKKTCVVFFKRFKYFWHSSFRAILVVCPDILCESCGPILVPASVKGHTTTILFANYLPEMTSIDLNKALVPIDNQLIKRNGGQIASINLKCFRPSFFDAILVVVLQSDRLDYQVASHVYNGH